MWRWCRWGHASAPLIQKRGLCSLDELGERTKNGVKVLVYRAGGDCGKLEQAWNVITEWNCPKDLFLDEVCRVHGVATALKVLTNKSVALREGDDAALVFKRMLAVADDDPRNLDLVKTLHARAVKANVDLAKPLERTQRNWLKRGYSEPAISLFRYMREHKLLRKDHWGIYVSTLRAHAESDDVHGALRTLTMAREDGMQAVEFAYALIIKSAKRQNLHSVANHVSNEVKAQGIWESEMFQNFLKPSSRDRPGKLSVLRNQEYTPAQRDVLKQLSRFAQRGLDVTSRYQAVARWLRDKHKFDLVRFLYEEMRRRGVAPDVFTCNMIMEAYAHDGNLQGAKDLYERTVAGQIPVQVVFYEHLIKAHVSCNDIRGAQRVFWDVLKRGLKPTLSTFNNLASGYAKLNMLQQMEQITHIMHDVGVRPNGRTYTMLLKCTAQSNDTAKTMLVVNDMVRSGNRLDPFTLTTIMSSLFAQGAARLGIELFENVCLGEEAVVNPTVPVYTSLMRCYRAVSMLKKSLEVFEDLCRTGAIVDQPLVTEAMYAYLDDGGVRKAKQLFCDFRASSEVADAQLYSLGIRAATESGDLPEAVNIVLEALANGVYPKPHYIDTLYECLAQDREAALAEQLFQVATSAGLQPSSIAWHSVINAGARRGELGRALGWIDRMALSGLRPRTTLYNQVLNCATDIDAAILIIRRMCSRGSTPNMDTKKILTEKLATAAGLGANSVDVGLIAALRM